MIGVCITTLNEEATIGALVRYFAEQKDRFQVYVVDDCSTDRTQAMAAQAGAYYIRNNPERIGIGPSLMLAWREALDDGCDLILQIDAGGSHDPIDAEYLLLTAENMDLVIGSRFVEGAKYINFGRKLRPFLSQVAAWMCNWAHASCWKDWTSGFRVFSRPCAEKLLTYTYLSKMHGWQIETLARAGAAGFRIAETPIMYVAGRSSFNRKVAWEAFVAWTDVANHIGWLNSRLED